MSSIAICCSNCQDHYEVDACLSGKTILCRTCEGKIQVHPTTGMTDVYAIVDDKDLPYETQVASGSIGPVELYQLADDKDLPAQNTGTVPDHHQKAHELLNVNPPRYAEAVDEFLKAFQANPQQGKELVHCGMCYWVGVKHYFLLSSRVTIGECQSGAPDELFVTLTYNAETFPGGLLGRQIRASVGTEDRHTLAKCLVIAEACFRRGCALGAEAFALEWLLAMTRGVGRFEDCRQLVQEARDRGQLSAQELKTLQKWVEGIPRYESDLAWLANATGGWVVPTRDRLVPSVISELLARVPRLRPFLHSGHGNANPAQSGRVPARQGFSHKGTSGSDTKSQEKLRTICPHCKGKIVAAPQHFGKRVNCPACGKRFEVLNLEIPSFVLEVCPGSVAREYQVLPLAVDQDGVTVAIGDPTAYPIIDRLQFILNRPVKCNAGPVEPIRAEIARHYGGTGVEEPSVESMLHDFTETSVAKLVDSSDSSVLHKAPSSNVCDVCGQSVSHGAGYLLTTKQVVSTPAYWRHYYSMHESQFKTLGGISYKEFSTNPSLMVTICNPLVLQSTAWMVCDDCIGLFEYDRRKPREYAQRFWKSGGTFSPPGTGPASLSDVQMRESSSSVERSRTATSRRTLSGATTELKDLYADDVNGDASYKEVPTICGYCKRPILEPTLLEVGTSKQLWVCKKCKRKAKQEIEALARALLAGDEAVSKALLAGDVTLARSLARERFSDGSAGCLLLLMLAAAIAVCVLLLLCWTPFNTQESNSTIHSNADGSRMGNS